MKKQIIFLGSMTLWFSLCASAAEGDNQFADEATGCAMKRIGHQEKSGDDSAADYKPKKCKCLGHRSDGPLHGLCVIPCRCPGNCGHN